MGYALAGDGGGGGLGSPGHPALMLLWVTHAAQGGFWVMGPSEVSSSSLGGGISSRHIITLSPRQDRLNEKCARCRAERRVFSSLSL